MSITIMLDRPALKHLIDNDPEFKLSLHSAVMSEVGKHVLNKELLKSIKECERAVWDAAVVSLRDGNGFANRVQQILDAEITRQESSWSSNRTLSAKAKEALDRAVSDIKDRVIREASSKIEAALTELVKVKIRARMEEEDLDSRVEKRVERLLSDEINRRVKIGVDAKLAEMKQLLA